MADEKTEIAPIERSPIPTDFSIRELCEEVRTILWEKEQFVEGKVARRGMSPESERLERYRFARLRHLIRILEPMVEADKQARRASKAAVTHEDAGTAYDSGAGAHELVGRALAPPTTFEGQPDAEKKELYIPPADPEDEWS